MSATFTKTSWFHDLSPFVSATFMICVHDFPRWEVLVKVGILEFGLNTEIYAMLNALRTCHGCKLHVQTDGMRLVSVGRYPAQPDRTC